MVELKTAAALVVLAPLAGFLIISLVLPAKAHRAAAIAGCATVLVSFLLSVLVLLSLPSDGAGLTVVYFDWIRTAGLTASFAFLIDPLSALWLLIVTGIGFLIHVYSASYMAGDEGHNRFFAYLNLFVFFMLILVLGSNYLLMFAGWEGVGLCSYLLIGFWFKNKDYVNAANKAFIMNRVGDLGMVLAIILVLVNFGSVEYLEVFKGASGVSTVTLTAITLLLFVGAMGKSAQLPLYTWLPDAMAGPSPVSALIHAATMVTAGIYMVARNNLLYSLSPFTLGVIVIVGLATAIFAATIALAQNDIKKVLAYSTVSQLGLMFVALGLGAFSTGVFHVATHAFFKALLFLGAGSVIHALGGEQDVRRMGGLRKVLPVTFPTFLIGVLAISGIPPFAGFFSKDEILSKAYEHNFVVWILALIASLLTAFYMFRLLFLVFFGKSRAGDGPMGHAHESPWPMTIPLIVLAALATVSGFGGIPHVFHAPHLLADFLAPVFADSMAIRPSVALPGATELALMGVVIALTIVVIVMAFVRYVSRSRVPQDEGAQRSPMHRLVYAKYYVDELYTNAIVKPLFALSKATEVFVEKSGIDRLVNGFGSAVNAGGRTVRLMQTGSIGFYVLMMVLGIVALLLFRLF